MRCPVCTHPQRPLIEQRVARDGHPLRRVAGDFGLPLGAVLDHSRTHVLFPRPPAAACLPGLHEPYGFTAAGSTPRCRHCDTPLPEETP